MPEIDPVILQLKADIDRYVADVRGATTKVDKLLDQQGASARKLEAEMRRSSGAIGGHLKGLAGTLATYFSGRELVGLLDSFTRFQNQLRVAGLEGDKLTSVQDRLFASAQKYGVELEGLGGLFGKVTQSQRELGVSQEQVLRLTDLTSAALKITGATSAQSSGAILGLSQAFASGTVKAEEYNQILEGGLQPLLQAAANSEKFGGSLGKLRQAVVDGKVSSQEFFALILKGASDLESKAGKATLTTAAGFTTLTNALTVYFGEADKSNGVSAALGIALQKLAENLDTLIPAIALLAVAWGGSYVAAAGRAALSSAALIAAQLGVAGAAGTAGVAVGRLGAVLLTAFGGPVGAAIFAIGAAIYLFSQRTEEASQAAREKANATTKMAEADRIAAQATQQLANASAKERAALIASMQASRARAAQALQTAKAQIVEAQAALAVARANAQKRILDSTQSSRGAGGGIDPTMVQIGNASRVIDPAQAKLDAAEALYAKAQGQLEGLDRALTEATKPVKLAAAGGDGKKAPKGRTGGAGGGGPTAAEIEQRFLGEMTSYAQQALQAQASLATSAEERADLETRMVELARIRTLDEIKHTKDYSATQKARLTQQVEALAELERERIETEKKRRLEQESQQLADEQYRSTQDALRVQFDMADTQADRKRLALEMLDLENRYQESLLEAVRASKTASDAEKKRAQIALDGLRRLAPAQRDAASRQNETQVERYLRDLNRSPAQINEAIDSIKIDGLEALNDGLVDAITGAKSLGEVFKNVANQIIADLLRIAIQQAIIKPLAEALFPGSSGGSSGGGLLGAITSVASLFGGGSGGSKTANFGKAGGGPVAPGQFYRVNENATPGRVEGFMSRDGGQIIPLGQMDALRSGGAQGGTVRIVIEESPGFASRVETIATGVSVEVTRQTAPAIIDAATNNTLAKAGRPRL